MILVQVVLERGLGDAVLGGNLLKRLPAGLSLRNHDRPEFRPLR